MSVAGLLIHSLQNKLIMAEKEDMKQEPELEEKASEVEEKKKKQSRNEERKESELKRQVAELTDKLAKEKDDYIRLLAEFETFRRRSAEDRLSLTASAAADTVKGMLPVLDACERAMEMLASSADKAAIEGTNLIYNKLMDYLKTKGLNKIEAKGEKFDTDLHEAVRPIPAPSEDLKGKVVDVIQTGYTFNGKVLRYAKVVVGA